MATANAITFNGSLSIMLNTGLPIGMSFNNLIFNQTTPGVVYQQNFTVLTSATVIPLGGVSTPHWAAFQNLDPTNYVTIFNGSSGAVLCRLLGAAAGNGPYGDAMIICLDPTCVPYALANTASVQIAYLIANA